MMRRVAAAVAAVVTLAGATDAAAAGQKQVATKAVGQQRAAVKTYWSAARMRRAIPAALAQAGARAVPRAAAALAADEVPGDYTVAPLSAHGKVFFTSGGLDYVCSGTAITSANRSVVWTAGHCVNEGPGAFHTNWAFVPAYRDGARPLGTWAARRLLTTQRWRASGDVGAGLGAAVVSADGATTLNDRAGGRAIAFNGSRSLSVTAFGYPAFAPYSGGRLWTCASPVTGSDASVTPAAMAISCDLTAGASGGGWVAGGAVVSVTSYGYAARPDVLYGPYQGAEAQALFAAAQTG
jgi:V8-like Glu-specific endopeptidase